MPKLFGLLRVKNEARWIQRVIRSIWPVCDEVIVLDDHSTDGTAHLAEDAGIDWLTNPVETLLPKPTAGKFRYPIVHRSTFSNMDEARDRDVLLQLAWEVGARIGDYCLMVDGDEQACREDLPEIEKFVNAGLDCGMPHIIYLWNDEHTVRVDRWYAQMIRPSLFRLTSRDLAFKRTGSGQGANMHCSSAPWQLLPASIRMPVRLLHYGYMLPEDRVRKYHWYNEKDPGNELEDRYRHMVIGDLFPADSVFKWAGPLELKPLKEVLK
jgi:glycosyltransferase involved in cell wall biosynthesis